MIKYHAIQAESIHDLEDKINEFGKTSSIKFSQIYPHKKEDGYDCLLGYEAKEIDDIKPVDKKFSNKPTEKQMWYLKEHLVGDIPKDLTFDEATKMIGELKEKE